MKNLPFLVYRNRLLIAAFSTEADAQAYARSENSNTDPRYRIEFKVMKRLEEGVKE